MKAHFSALPDAGDFRKWLLVQPAAMSAFSYSIETMPTTDSDVYDRLFSIFWHVNIRIFL